MRTIISIFGFNPEQQQRIREAAPGWRVIFGKPRELDPSVFREAEVMCEWASAIALEALGEDSKLRWVQTGSAGVDYLPLEEFRQRGVILTNASGVHPVPMTETIFAMLLAFSRNLHQAIRHQSARKWERSASYGELRGRTIGIIGVGEVGTETARIAQAFGMRTLGVRRSGKPAPHIDEMYPTSALDEVLAKSDIVVNILPYTEETDKLYDASKFARMKKTALFINMGRGPSVDTDALVDALRQGQIAGAGLDVFDPEPLPAEHPLWAMDNVIITPHIGGATEQYKERMTELFVANLTAYMASGAPARNVVDYGLSY